MRGTYRFGFLVTSVQVVGSPPRLVRAAATLFFLASDEPFCCGEPGCHFEIFAHPGDALGEYLRARMDLRQPVIVELEISTNYAKGIRFTAHG